MAAEKTTKSRGAFPNMIGGFYRLSAEDEIFIPGVDGDPEFPTQNQTWRAIEPIDESDIESVIRDGVIQSISVRKRKDGRAEVVDGRQRARWVRAANLRIAAEGGVPITIPSRLEDPKSSEAKVYGRTLATNYHRVTPSPMQQSEDAARMLRLLGETDLENIAASSLAEVASQMRCSTAKVRNLVRLQRLELEVQQLVASRDLQMGPALGLVDMQRGEQIEEARKLALLAADGATVADLVERRRQQRDADGVNEGTGQTAADAEGPAKKGLRAAQVKGLLRLALADREAGAGAGAELDGDVIKLLKIITGEARPSTLKGVTELLNRLAARE